MGAILSNDFALLPDKYHHFYGTGDRKCVISYALWRDIAVTLAGPIGLAARSCPRLF